MYLIIAVQEHWFTNDKLYLLISVHSDFVAFAASGMINYLASAIYRARPFGVVVFLSRKSSVSKVSIIGADDNG